MRDTNQAYKIMKSIKFFSTFAVAVIAVLALSSFVGYDAVSKPEVTEEVHTHAHAEGKYCNGTVGCDCTGFSPKTDGKEWEKSYCKRCGHHRRCHR